MINSHIEPYVLDAIRFAIGSGKYQEGLITKRERFLFRSIGDSIVIVPYMAVNSD